MIKSDIFLSVVVTALNEENNVDNCIKYLSRFLEDHLNRYEIIFVNDGSTDQTKEKLEDLKATKNLKVIHLEHNVGTGGAIKKALEVLNGDWYCWLPSDLEIMPEELWRPLQLTEHSDFVITYISNGEEVRSKFRNFLSKSFIFLMNKTFSTDIKYFNGLSLIKTSFVRNQEIGSNRFFFHAELLLKVLMKTKNYRQAPISLSPRSAGRSKALRPKVLFEVVSCYLRSLWELKIKNANPDY